MLSSYIIFSWERNADNTVSATKYTESELFGHFREAHTQKADLATNGGDWDINFHRVYSLRRTQ